MQVKIPIFTSQLEKSRDAVSVANLRAAYAEAATTALTEDKTKVVVENVQLKGTKKDSFSGLAKELPFTLDATITDKDGEPKPIKVEFDFTNPDKVNAKLKAE